MLRTLWHLLVFISATFCLISCSALQSEVYEYPLAPNKSYKQNKHLEILGSLGLKPTHFNNLPVTELSGIAWDKDEKLLYAISDEGLIYHLDLTIKNQQLIDIKIVFSARLKNKKKESLKGKFSDSEGLSLINGSNGIRGDSELVISFENLPRIAHYSPKGEFLNKIMLPKKLQNLSNYRNKNKALESVTVHPTYGTLTASEYPLKNSRKKYQTIFSNTQNNQTNMEWYFLASKEKNSAITGLETMENGDLLILERAWVDALTPIVITLRQLQFNKCNKKNECETKVIASLSGADGWYLDNFEGLAHYDKNLYFMISDNNQNALQNTVLVFFKINQ